MTSLQELGWINSRKSSKSAKSTRHKEEAIEVFRPANVRFRKAIEIQSYRLAHYSTHDNEQYAKHITEWACRLQIQMKSQLFDPWT